jgi:hypothetical protein
MASKTVRFALGISAKWLVAAVGLVIAAASLEAVPAVQKANFDFTLFALPGNPQVISAQGINNLGVAVGASAPTSAGPYTTYVRTPDGKIITLIAPGDTYPVGFGFTRADGINDEGTVVGSFYNDAAGQYQGFFFRHNNWTTYNVPNQPGVGDSTEIVDVNDAGDFCGYIGYPAGTFGPTQTSSSYNAFVSIRGVLTVFSAPGAPPNSANGQTLGYACNIWGEVSGYYFDAAGVAHGYLRYTNGTFKTIDFPGASMVQPKGGGSAGTAVNGLNDFGEISGHYFDQSYNEHGFVLTPDGKFLQFDVPGAVQTGGGNVNDLGQVTGHYVDGNGVSKAFIGTPAFDGDNDSD